MNLRKKPLQTSLIFISICFFISLAQGSFWDDAVKKAKSVTEEVVKSSVDDMGNDDVKSSGNSPEKKMSTDSTKEKPATGNSSSTKISSAAENRQSVSAEETTARQHVDVDIVGLKLGMTQDQVIAVLKKHNKDLQITFGEFKVTPNARKQHAHLPNHVTSINAQIGTGMRPREKNRRVFL